LTVRFFPRNSDPRWAAALAVAGSAKSLAEPCPVSPLRPEAPCTPAI